MHGLLFTRCDSVDCIYNCFEYWQREEGLADRRAIAVAHVEDQKPCLQRPCSGETISCSSRVAVRWDGRAGGVTAAPSEQIVQFPRQAPFFNISSSSKLSLSNDVTFPAQEASLSFLWNYPFKLGEGNWKSQVAGHWACCVGLFPGQSRSARRRKEAVTVVAWWKRGSNECPLCSAAFRGRYKAGVERERSKWSARGKV